MGIRIGVDARVIPRYPGLGRCCLNILNELSRIDEENEYVIFAVDPSLSALEEKKNFRVVQVGFQVLSLGTLFRLSSIVKREKVDLFYAPFQITPLGLDCPMVVTVHDMMDLLYPDAFTHHPFLIRHGLSAYFRFNIPRSIRNASKIIAVSASTKKHIHDYFGLADEMVQVVLNGLESKFRPVKENVIRDKIKNKYRLPERFILYLGSIKPYKNLTGVLQAYLRLQQERPDLRDVKLIIAGLKHFSMPSVQEMLDNDLLKDKVMQIGYVDEEDLPVVYSLAEVFFFPSIWEGFGLPALEAMACGTPVVTSNTSSLPEVVGDAGVQADPHIVDDMSNALHRVLSDEILQAEMIEKGIKQAAKFSWEDAARKSLQVFLEVYDEKRRT